MNIPRGHPLYKQKLDYLDGAHIIVMYIHLIWGGYFCFLHKQHMIDKHVNL